MTNVVVGILAAAILPGINKGKENANRWVHGIRILWCTVLLLYYLSFLPLVWEGSGKYFGPVCMLLLGLWGARKGYAACAGVGAVLLLLVSPLLGGIGLAAIEDINWKWAASDAVGFDTSIVTACLLPGMMNHYKGDNKHRTKLWYLLLPLVSTVFCLVIRGIVPELDPGTIGLTELGKSIEVFGRVMRLEAIVAMAMTISLYCLVSMLLAAVNQSAESIVPDRKEWLQVSAGIAVFSGMLCKITISDDFAAIGSIICWAILPLVTQIVGIEKKE